MKSALQIATGLGDALKERVRQLVVKHSLVVPRDIDSPGMVVVTPAGDHKWGRLSAEGKLAQADALRAFQKLDEMLGALMPTLPNNDAREFEAARAALLDMIQQDKPTNFKNIRDVVGPARESIDAMLGIVAAHSQTSSERFFVPDTNALVSNPHLERWVFPDAEQFTILLVPQVLSELDELKITHRVPDVRDKAKSLIRGIKEYRRRGSLSEGVPLVNGRSKIASCAVEPNVKGALPWLDPASGDDRLIASVIEIMRANPGAAVALVTGDINAQNKADFAGLPYVEPPEDNDE